MNPKLTLIVEDVPEAAELLRRVVTQAFAGTDIRDVADVASALQVLTFAKPDLALVDLSLPDGNGLQVIEAIGRRYCDCVIVVASIFDDDGHIFPALQAGAQGYLLKSDPEEKLVNGLLGIGAGQPPLSAAIARRLLGFFQGPAAPQGEALTPREQEVLRLLGRGIRINAIADSLGISRHTAGDHVKNIYRKLNISSRAEAVAKAARLGMID